VYDQAVDLTAISTQRTAISPANLTPTVAFSVPSSTRQLEIATKYSEQGQVSLPKLSVPSLPPKTNRNLGQTAKASKTKTANNSNNRVQPPYSTKVARNADNEQPPNSTKIARSTVTSLEHERAHHENPKDQQQDAFNLHLGRHPEKAARRVIRVDSVPISAYVSALEAEDEEEGNEGEEEEWERESSVGQKQLQPAIRAAVPIPTDHHYQDAVPRFLKRKFSSTIPLSLT
jgi:hypothetical protein